VVLVRNQRGAAAFESSRRGRDADPEPEEFSSDPDAAPAWILTREPKDELAGIGIDPGSAGTAAVREGPLAAHQLPMPAQQGLRAHQ